MSLMDDILARSRTPGRFVERSRFSLSKDKALEKIREFSLRHPKQYVLELVQAANFAGATYIAVNIEPAQLVLAWVGGPPLQAQELERLFDYLFIRSSRASTRHLHQLAIGVNALLQRKPDLLRLESGDGTQEGTTRLDMSAAGDGIIGVPENPMAGTYLMVQFKRGWLERFTQSFSAGALQEEVALIDNNCLYTPVPILLNGRAPFGWKASKNTVFGPGSINFNENGRRGSLQAPSGRLKGHKGIHLVIGGVRVITRPIAELGALEGQWQSLIGVICDDSLRKTADQSSVVEDEAWIRMLHAVQPHATRAVHSPMSKADRRDYKSPVLPVLSQDIEEEKEHVPLPDRLAQLAPRPELPFDGLVDLLKDGGPVFYAQSQDAQTLVRGADPQRFPYPVFLLSDREAEYASKAAGIGAIPRISTDADVAFIRRALERGYLARSVRCPFEALGGTVTGDLVLTVTLEGQRAAWGDPGLGCLPAAMAYGDETLWCTHLPLQFPGVRAVFELSQSPGTLAEGWELALATELSTAIHAQTWQLAVQIRSHRTNSASRALLLALLNHHAQAHIYRVGGRLKLSALLPPAWGAELRHLQSTVLVQTSEGPLTLDRLASLQGTQEIITMDSSDELETLHALESRFGYGHLWHPEHRTPISVLGVPLGRSTKAGVKFHKIEDPTRDVEGYAVMVWSSLERESKYLPEGWTALDLGIPHLGAAVSPETEHVLDLSLIQEIEREFLDSLADKDGIAKLSEARPSRARAALRLALFGLGARLGRPNLEPPTTFEECLLYEQATGTPWSLAVDDAPSVWHSLQQGRSEGWLIHTSVAIPGLTGWLGLRTPYDSSGGLLLQSFNNLWSESEPDPSLPCHGLLIFSSPRDSLTDWERQLLQHAQHQLYRNLLDKLSPSHDSPSEIAMHRYALHYVGPRLPALGESGAAEADRLVGLATQLQVFKEGEPWGTLNFWVHSDPGQRPSLPVAISRESPGSNSPSGQSFSRVRAASPSRLMELRENVGRALGLGLDSPQQLSLGLMPGVVVQSASLMESNHLVRLVSQKNERFVLRLDPRYPLVTRALSGDDVQAWHLLVMECCRVLVKACEDTGHSLDLHAAHQYLVSERL